MSSRSSAASAAAAVPETLERHGNALSDPPTPIGGKGSQLIGGNRVTLSQQTPQPDRSAHCLVLIRAPRQLLELVRLSHVGYRLCKLKVARGPGSPEWVARYEAHSSTGKLRKALR